MQVRCRVALAGIIMCVCVCLDAMEHKNEHQKEGQLIAGTIRVHRKKQEHKKQNNPPGGPEVDDQHWHVIPLVPGHKDILQKYQDAKSSEEAHYFLEQYNTRFLAQAVDQDEERFRHDLGEAQAVRARHLMQQNKIQLDELSALIASKALSKDDQDSLRTDLTEQLVRGKQDLQRRCASCCGMCGCR